MSKSKVNEKKLLRKKEWKESQQVEKQIKMLNEMEEVKKQKPATPYIPAWQQYQQRVQSQTAAEIMSISNPIALEISPVVSSIKTLDDVLAAIQRIEKPR